MRKIFPAFLLFSLLQASGPDSSRALTPEPAQAAAAEVQQEAQQVPGDDVRLFRRNAAKNPLVSAAALLRVLSGMTAAETEDFRGKNCGKIVEMLSSLERAAGKNLVPKEEYSRVASQLAAFDLTSIASLGSSRGPEAGGGEKRDPVAALAAVRVAADSGDKAKTAAAIENARSSYPDNPSLQASAAASYNEAGDYSMARKVSTIAIALDPANPDAYRARALARASLEDRKGAIEDIRKAVEIDPQDESVRVLAALLESRKSASSLKSVASVEEIRRAFGDAGQAEDAVEGGAGAGTPAGAAPAPAAPDQARSKVYLKTALTKSRLGDYENAVRYAGLAIEKDPDNLDAYLERANACNFLGRYDDVVRDTSFVIAKDPARLEALNMRAWALNSKGQSQAAETDASRVIDLDPNFADAWYNRALAYEKQGDHKRMLADLKQASALNGAYLVRYQDAVAQYGSRVPDLEAQPPLGEGKGDGRHRRSPLKRFLITLLFTLSGGTLIAMGLTHIFSARSAAADAASRKTHPDLLSPSIFYEGVATGKYKIERKLGEGGMGVVYLATDQSLGREVAIKKMGDEIKINDTEKQRFLDEARTVALLHHPNVVEIYTIFEEEDNIYLVFEYVDGLTLDRVLDKETRISPEKALPIFDSVAKALAYAHSKSVVHCDLKLSNIMLSGEGEVKVMDFGLARRARESMARLSKGEVVGSPAYMAPEQELGSSEIGSDIYSLGVCLYEALCGALPFQGPDFHGQKMRGSYQALSDMMPGLPRAVDGIVAKCLAPAPEDRFPSADDFRRALSEVI